jgi:hypothetical protein
MYFYFGTKHILLINEISYINQVHNIFSECLNKGNKQIISVDKTGNGTGIFIDDSLIFSYEEKNWLTCFLRDIPEIFKLTSDSYIFFHSSCVRINNIIFMFSGSSRSGKTTAVYNLLKNKKYQYISDDVTIYDTSSGGIIPLDFIPLRLRTDILCDDGIVVPDPWDYKTFSLVNVGSGVHQFGRTPCVLVFIDIEYCDKNSIKKIDKNEGFKLIITRILNIKETDIKHLKNFICNIESIFECKYSGDIEKLVWELSSLIISEKYKANTGIII